MPRSSHGLSGASLLALAAALLAGCYDMHGRLPGEPPPTTDAGVGHDGGSPPPPPPLDAGPSCAAPPLEGHPSVLDCPASARRGELIVVTLTHHSGACCADSAALPTEVRPGRDTTDFGLLPRWNACECCLECACVGGSATERVEIGAFDAGVVVGVRAGDLSCAIPVVDEPRLCHAVPPTRWLVPATVRAGARVPVGVLSEVTSCSCTPRIDGPPPGGSTVALSLCDCCDECECVDPPADGTVEIVPSTPGPWAFTAPSGARSPMVYAVAAPESSCTPATIVGAALVAPDPTRMSATPGAVWLRLEVDSRGCCLTPRPFVDTQMLRGGPPQFALTAYECGPDPCDCDTFETFRTETDHYLGTWPSGRYAVSLGSGLPPLAFTVP